MKRKSENRVRSYTQHHTSAVPLRYEYGTSAESRPERDFDLDDLVIVEGCDVAIAEGVRQIRQEIAKSPGRCTLNSRQYSLRSLVKKFLDQPVAKFLKQRCPDWGDFCTSDSLRKSVVATRNTIRWIIRERANGGESCATLETLMYFAEFCEGRDAMAAHRAEYCELCWRRTEEEESQWRPIKVKLGFDAAMPEAPAQVYRRPTKEHLNIFNARFCAIHDPQEESTAYRSAFAQREKFRKALKSATDWYVNQGLVPLPEEIRSVAYMRVHPKERGSMLREIAARRRNSYGIRVQLFAGILGGCASLKQRLEESGEDILAINANSDGRVFIKMADGSTAEDLFLPDAARESVISKVSQLVWEKCDRNNPSLKVDFPKLGVKFTGLVAPIVQAPAFSIKFESPGSYTRAIREQDG